MLISHRKQFIFTKTIKTAGTSVESYFEPYCMKNGEWKLSHKRTQYVSETGIIGARLLSKKEFPDLKWYNHMPAKEIRVQLGDDIWDNYFRFTTIRNPYDKILSLFFYKVVRRRKVQQSENEYISLFRDWVKNISNLVIDRDKYTIDGKVCINEFIRYENLHSDLAKICNILKIKYDPVLLPNLKSGFRPRNTSITKYYDKASADIIQNIYEFEFDHFNYSIKIS